MFTEYHTGFTKVSKWQCRIAALLGKRISKGVYCWRGKYYVTSAMQRHSRWLKSRYEEEKKKRQVKGN